DRVEQPDQLLAAIVDDVPVIIPEGFEIEGAHASHESADQHRFLARRQVNARFPADQRLEQRELVVAYLGHRLRMILGTRGAARAHRSDASPASRPAGSGSAAPAGARETSTAVMRSSSAGDSNRSVSRNSAKRPSICPTPRRYSDWMRVPKSGTGFKSAAVTSITRPSSVVSSPRRTASPLHTTSTTTMYIA